MPSNVPTDTSTERPAPTPLRFGWAEHSGSLGDLGILLPLVVAVTVQVRLDLGIVLIAFGAMNLLSGFWFRQPVPAQPMKAIAAVAIAEGMSGGALAASGLLMGAILLALALTGAMDVLRRYIPKGIVRGIQLGVGLKLAARGLEWVSGLELVGLDSILVAALAGALLLVMTARRVAVLMPVFGAGFVLLLIADPAVIGGIGLGQPAFEVRWPTTPEFSDGLLRGVLPQLPLTLLNSVIAVCALSSDYFPGRGIPHRRMATGLGVMNLVAAPFGAMPMCYGAGGLAATYRFGGRTGGAVIILGGGLVAVGLLLGSTLLPVLDAYPRSILGVMLALAGVELARSVRDIMDKQALGTALVTAACILGVNAGAGFLVGLAFHLLTRKSADA